MSEEAKHTPPGVFAGVGVLSVGAVEERVGRARVDLDLVLDVRVAELALEHAHLLDRDALVGPAEQA